VVLSLVSLAGCHTMVPLSEDEGGYAPILAPPLTAPTPGVGTSVGFLAPDFKLNDLEDREITLDSYRGRPVMLNFWTYCDICKEELPYIQVVYEERESFLPDMVVLAVNVSQPAGQVEEFVGYNGFSFQFLVDTWATVASDYYINEIPTTFFIDRNGIIQDVHVGLLRGPGEIREKLTRLGSR